MKTLPLATTPVRKRQQTRGPREGGHRRPILALLCHMVASWCRQWFSQQNHPVDPCYSMMYQTSRQQQQTQATMDPRAVCHSSASAPLCQRSWSTLLLAQLCPYSCTSPLGPELFALPWDFMLFMRLSFPTRNRESPPWALVARPTLSLHRQGQDGSFSHCHLCAAATP